MSRKDECNRRIIFNLMIFLGIVTSVVLSQNTVNAFLDINKNAAFVISPTPTVNHEVAYTVASTATVTNETEFVAAYTNTAISRIVLANDISVGNAKYLIFKDFVISRDLQIDGSGFALVFTNLTSGDWLFNLTSSAASPFTFHLKDINISKLSFNGSNYFIIGGNTLVSVIIDNLTSDSGLNYYRYWGFANGANLFFRNNVVMTKLDGEITQSVRNIIFEKDSNVILNDEVVNTRDVSLFWDEIGGSPSNAYIDGTLSIEKNSATYPVFYLFENINIGSTGTLNVLATQQGGGTAIINAVGTTIQTWRVDGGGTLSVESTTDGPAVKDETAQLDFKSNPGANVEFIGNTIYATIYLEAVNSTIILDNPNTFNIVNNKFSATVTVNKLLSPSIYNTTVETLQILNSDIGLWARGTNLNGIATTPSPFTGVTLRTMGGPLMGTSSPIINTMPGGFNLNKYQRIAKVPRPVFSASDVSVSLNKTKLIDIIDDNATDTFTFVSNDTTVATVNASGTVTGLKVGTTTITITAVNTLGGSETHTINVTVTNNIPILTVDLFTEIAVGDTFNPTTGVSASDIADGDITPDITVTNNVDTNADGLYTVIYSITNSVGNKTTKTRVVLVNDGTYSVGTNYILKASDFSIRKNLVNTADSALISEAKAAVYDKVTAALVSNGVTVTSKGGYTNTVADYTIQFAVTAELLTTKSIKGSVITGGVPTITIANNFVELGVNDTYDLFTGVSATDTEDGALTGASITKNVNLDTSVAGLTLVTYTATDSDGNSVTSNRTVLVNDGNYTAGNGYVLYANDFSIRKSLVTRTEANIIALAQAKVYDKVTALPVVNGVKVNDYTTYNQIVGIYDIIFEAVPESTLLKTIKANVVTGDIPVLSVPAFTEVLKDATFDVQLNVNATDTEDGVITNKIVTNSYVNTAVAGVYRVEYTITDLDLNTVVGYQVVLVNDGSYVAGTDYIVGAYDFLRGVGQVDTNDSAINLISKLSVYDKMTGFKSVSPVTINKNGYSSTIAIYDITFTVDADSTATRTIKAEVSALNAPEITYTPFTELSVGQTFDKNAGFSALDLEDGDLTANSNTTVVSDVNTSVAGVYTVIYTVKDSDLNVVTKTQVVLVNDGNYFAGTDYIVKATDFTKRISEVDNTNPAIIIAGNVEIFSLKTGLQVNTVNKLVNSDGGYKAISGIYSIEIGVETDSSAKITIDATVTNGTMPVLTVPAFTQIATGASFDENADVSATDTEDGNLTVSTIGSVDVNTEGVYTFNYEAEDLDGNIVKATQVVLVTDGSFVAGSDFIIGAQGFTKRVSQVDNSKSGIISATNVLLYDKVTGQPIPNYTDSDLNVNDGGYTGVVNIYDINISHADDAAASIIVKGNVVAGEMPLIILPDPSPTVVAKDATFDVLNGVTASDVEDGDLTSSINVDIASVDTSTFGIYKLTYDVKDLDGNITTLSRTIVVDDGNIAVGSDYLLYAKDFTLRTGEVVVLNDIVLNLAQVEVYDLVTANLVTNGASVANFGGYAAVANTYNVEYTVSAEPALTLVKKAVVTTGDVPVLAGLEFLEINVGDAFDPNMVVTATDTEDATNTLVVKLDNGSVDVNTAGVYTLSYSVEDSDFNVTTGTKVVLVNNGDYVAGSDIIIKANSFELGVGQVDTAEAAVLAQANVVTYLIADGSIANDVVLIDIMTYSASVGEYDISFTSDVDSSATITIKASVIARSLPELVVTPFVEINLNATIDLKVGATATDIEDGDLTNVIIIDDSLLDTSKAGLYPITYTVKDSDKNIVSVSSVVLVNDGSFVAGANYVIQASDFTVMVSAVDLDPLAMQSNALVTVFDKTTALVVNVPVLVTDDGNYTNVAGNYNVTFAVEADPLAKRTIVATVDKGNDPVLNFVTPLVIPINSVFVPLDNVSATDTEDGAITSIDATSTVDSTLAGVYTVEYSVTDLDLNTVTKTQVVVVDDGSFKLGTTHIIQAYPFTKRVGQVNLEGTSDTVLLGLGKVNVYDVNTGAKLSLAAQVDNNDGYSSVVNDYSITYSCIDETSTFITITASVVTGFVPQLVVPSITEVALNGAFDNMDNVFVSDIEDPLTIDDVIVSAGMVDVNKAGVYTLNYVVVDSDNNTSTATRVVVVNDGSFVIGADYIIQAYDFTLGRGQVSTNVDDIKADAGLKVYDIKTGLPVTSVVDVYAPDYQAVTNAYNITFTVASDGTTKGIVANVIDGNVPTLTVRPFVEINVNDSFDVMDTIVATDIEDGDLTTKIVPTPLTIDTSVAGVYQVEYTVEDSDFNIITKYQTILVNDGNYVAGDNYIIYAKDFTNRVGQVIDNPSVIQANASVKVIDIVSAQEVVVPLTISYIVGNEYKAAVGAYDITYTVDTDTKANTTILGTVVSGDTPVLTIDTPIVIAPNDVFDVTKGVNATDTEDGDLTLVVAPDQTSFNSSTVGVFTINYQVADSDQNSVTMTRVIIVDDGSFVFGKDYALQAYNYTNYVSEIINGGLNDSSIIQNAKARVYDLKTGAELINDVVIDNKGGLSATPQDYDVTYSVLNDSTITSTIIATVTGGDKPQIIGAGLFEVPVNDSFDNLSGVTVVDTEDVTIDNSSIIITGTVDTSVAGVYPIQYTVTDADNNVVTLTRVVVVNDGTYVIGTNFIIKAHDYTVGKGHVELVDSSIIANAEEVVYDINTGLVVNETVTVDYGAYDSVVGAYEITFTVDSDGTKVTVTANVIDGNLPVIDVRSFVEINVNDSFDILDTLSATDVEDGDITVDVITDVNSIDTSVAGVYKVDYTVTDTDQNTVTVRQVILVNDGTYVAGDDYIINGNDFTLRISQVDTTEIIMQSNAQIVLYSKLDGAQVNLPVTITDGGYTSKVGLYDINFALANDAKANITITATVIAGEVPTIDVPEKISEVTIDTTFDALIGISANDTEDGLITEFVQVDYGDFDTTVAGVYKLTYTITDKDGNSVSDTRIVVVNDGTFVIGSKYIIRALDYTVNSGKVVVDPTDIQVKANFNVYDVTTGLLTASAIDVNYGDYSSTVNDYPITFTVIEDNTSINITAHVIGGEVPVITSNPFVEVNLNDSFNLFSNITATDKEDGPIAEKDYVITGAVNTEIAGLYPIIYTVTDSDFNTVSYYRVILVNDGTYVPGQDYIIKAQDYTLGLGQVNLDHNAILNSAKTHVYEKATGLEVSTNVSVDPGSYAAKLGKYPVTLTVDADATQTIIDVNVVTGSIPSLDVRPFYEIKVGDTIDLKDTLVANDTEDGLMTDAVIINQGSLDVNVAGVYLIEYTITDSDSNIVKATQSVLVNDGTYITGDKYIIQATDYTIYAGKVNVNDTVVKVDSSLNVYDKFNSQLSNVPVNVKSNSGYSSVAGEYKITLVVDKDTKATTSIMATVITGDAPVFTETDKFIELPVIKKTESLASFVSYDLMEGIAVLDTEDGDLSGVIDVITNLDFTVPGVYKVTYKVTDSDFNTSELYRTYLINDGSYKAGATHIISSKDFTINKNNVKDTASELIKGSDVHVYSIETSYEVFDSTLVVDDGGYTAKAGVYDVTYGTSLDNSATNINKVNVINTDIPVPIKKPQLPNTGQDSAVLIILVSALVAVSASYYKRRAV